MSNRILQIALRISLLKEEFSEKEISEAVKLLEQCGSSARLLEHLSENKEMPATQYSKKEGRKTRSVDGQKSRSIIDLEQKDPDKYQILSEFDSLIRKGSVLPKLEDLRKLGEQLSQSFGTPKTRREAISKVMSLLAERPIDEIKDIMSEATKTKSLDDKSNEYQELANFIINGKESQID